MNSAHDSSLSADGDVNEKRTSPISIIVNHKPFPSVEEAAESEEMVNWWDADLTDDRACTESFAGMELLRFLQACTDFPQSAFRFASPQALPESGDVFLLGSRESNPLLETLTQHTQEGLTTGQSFHIRSFQENNRTITVIEGGDRTGTLYGVYAYLEQLGIRFYGLGEKGTIYPKRVQVFPPDLNQVENPSFLSRGFIGLGNRGERDLFFWMARNRMNFCDETRQETHFRKKLGMVLAAGGHGIQQTFIGSHSEYPYRHAEFGGNEDKPEDPYPVSTEYAGDANGDGKLSYFEAHPEWYGLRNGKRSSDMAGYGGDNYCTSNRDATRELVRQFVQSLIDGPWKHVDIINLWMLDRGNWCQCENCARQGNFSDRLFELSYTIQKEMQNAREEGLLQRDVMLASLAYHETIVPPSRPLPDDFDYENFTVTYFPIERCFAHSLADPSCTEINQFLLENYQGWTLGEGRHYKGSIFIGEYYNVSSFKSLPVLFPQIMAVDVPWYHRTGARHFNYMHTPTHLWGTWTLNQSLLARLLWNSSTDADNFMDEYFHRYYPTTSGSTRAFYRHLERATANFKAFKHYAGEHLYKMRNHLIQEDGELFPLEHLKYEAHHPAVDDGIDVVEMQDAMREARRHLDASLLHCSNEAEEERLIEDNSRFVYGEVMIRFYYHLVRTAILHRRKQARMARLEFKEAEKSAGELREIRDVVTPLPGKRLTHITASDGFEASQAEAIFEFFKEKYGLEAPTAHEQAPVEATR